jgi:hypothetical protein
VEHDFLEKLFILRRVFHHCASTEADGSRVVLVCWVDVVLATMCDAIGAIVAQIQPTDFDSNSTLQSHKNEARLRAITQLPGKLKHKLGSFLHKLFSLDDWPPVPNHLTSSSTSPLARRSALVLLFGCFVMRLQLQDEPQEVRSHCKHEKPLRLMEYYPCFKSLLASTRNACDVLDQEETELMVDSLNGWDEMELAILIVLFVVRSTREVHLVLLMR